MVLLSLIVSSMLISRDNKNSEWEKVIRVKMKQGQILC